MIDKKIILKKLFMSQLFRLLCWIIMYIGCLWILIQDVDFSKGNLHIFKSFGFKFLSVGAIIICLPELIWKLKLSILLIADMLIKKEKKKIIKVTSSTYHDLIIGKGKIQYLSTNCYDKSRWMPLFIYAWFCYLKESFIMKSSYYLVQLKKIKEIEEGHYEVVAGKYSNAVYLISKQKNKG